MKNLLDFDEHIVGWPKHFRPLPTGYSVIWSERLEHYLPLGDDGELEGPINWDRFAARRWCFAHAEM